MKVYLDACCLNRPFDDQSQDRIRLEFKAIIIILKQLCKGEWKWIGSEALEIEIENTLNNAPLVFAIMIDAVNNAGADVLWVGMTAPKQEKGDFRGRPLVYWFFFRDLCKALDGRFNCGSCSGFFIAKFNC